MYDDQPMWCAYDHAKKAFFADHPLAAACWLGREHHRLTREQMQAYYDRRYVAPKLPWRRRQFRLVRRRRPGRKALQRCRRRGARMKHPPRAVHENEQHSPPQVAQEHVFVLSPAPAPPIPCATRPTPGHDHRRRFRQALPLALVDPGLVESRRMAFHEYDGAGAYYTSFSCEPEATPETWTSCAASSPVQADGVTRPNCRKPEQDPVARRPRSERRWRMQSPGRDCSTWQLPQPSTTSCSFQAVTLADIRTVLDRIRSTAFRAGPRPPRQAWCSP